MGSFPLIVGYFLTIVSQICCYSDFYCVDTLSIFSPLTAALHVVDLILNFLLLHCGYFGALVYLSISPKHWHFESLSYIKKQQEQAEAQNKTISSRVSTVEACFNSLVQKFSVFAYLQLRAVQPVCRDWLHF